MNSRTKQIEFARSCYDLHSSHYRPLSTPENILKACTPDLCCVTIQAHAWHDRYVTSSGGHASHLVAIAGQQLTPSRCVPGQRQQLTPSRCVPGQRQQLTPGMTGTSPAQAVTLRTWWRSLASSSRRQGVCLVKVATSSRLVNVTSSGGLWLQNW